MESLLRKIIKEIAKKGAKEIEIDGIPYLITHFAIFKITDKPCDCYCHTNTSNNLPCGSCIITCYYGFELEKVISL
jgi:hypothetical protein